jgi:hypothetical protein
MCRLPFCSAEIVAADGTYHFYFPQLCFCCAVYVGQLTEIRRSDGAAEAQYGSPNLQAVVPSARRWDTSPLGQLVHLPKAATNYGVLDPNTTVYEPLYGMH